MSHSPRRWRSVAVAGLTAACLVAPVAGQATAAVAPAAAATRPAPLTNLDHLDWLTVAVDPPAQAGHTTYRLGKEPEIGTLWTYAEPNDDGSYRYVGGGSYDADSNTWSQGAFNADDVTRAAVVYLRHWQATGSTASRESAYDLLRGVAYHQTVTGPDAGNVVLWMQPDGTLNESAEPVELPDPSDSDASYWLARTIWALGEGYAAFEDTDPAFARFLERRLDLALDAVDRQVLDAYGEFLNIDGRRTPAWLIADGADATAEAVLGLTAYVDAGGTPQARRVLTRLAEGVAALGRGNARKWPVGSVLPWALSRSIWHAWGSQMPAALAEAATTLGDPSLLRPALRDSFTFDPWMLTSGGPDQGRLPTAGDTSQIAYGADSRLQSLLATAEASDNVGTRRAGRRLAGMVGAWYFGANRAAEATYDPATGRTFDGISGDGVINRNSGAESTIHGLLSMIALDEHPGVARAARVARLVEREGTSTLQVEDGVLSGDARAVTPESLWTGESLFGGTGYAALGHGGRASMDLGQLPASLVMPVVDLRRGSDARTTVRADGRWLGVLDSGRIGRQGDSPAPGALLPVTLPRTVAADAGTLTFRTRTDGARARLDAVMVEPLVSRLVLRGVQSGTALLRSASDRPERATVRVPGDGPARVQAYDGRGRPVAGRFTPSRTVTVVVPAGGFVLVTR